MKILITGGAGFIGSFLVDELLKEGHHILVLDNLSLGNKKFIKHNLKNDRFSFVNVNLLENNIKKHFNDLDEVWHLAANPDVREGLINRKKHIKENFYVTFNVLESMINNGVKRIFYTSSSTVYGEAKKIPTPENYAPLKPISLYGATKLASEALISSYSDTYDIKYTIMRLANIIGYRSNHGIIVDFINKLNKNNRELEILGNGEQKKSYLIIDDCIQAMMILRKSPYSINEIYNIGSEDQINVKKIAEIVSNEMGFNPDFRYTGGKRGWKGDVTEMLLDVSKLKKIGWKIKNNSKNSIIKTIKMMK